MRGEEKIVHKPASRWSTPMAIVYNDGEYDLVPSIDFCQQADPVHGVAGPPPAPEP
jgi:hypothetical protein